MKIRVTNGWATVSSADRQPIVTKTYTFTSPKFYKADAPLQPSGLLGPLRILRATEEGKTDNEQTQLIKHYTPKREATDIAPIASCGDISSDINSNHR